MPRYEDLSEQEQNAAAMWQQIHRDNLDYFVEGNTDARCHTHIGTVDDTPHYIVALTNSDGIVFALGIETAYQVWQRALMAWYTDLDYDPIIISPVNDPTIPNIHGRMDWAIPLMFNGR